MNEKNIAKRLEEFYGTRYEQILSKKKKALDSLLKFKKEFHKHFDIRRDFGTSVDIKDQTPKDKKLDVKEILYAKHDYTFDITYEVFNDGNPFKLIKSYQFEIFIDFDKPDEYLFQSDISNNKRKVILSKEDILKKIEEDLFKL